MLASDLEGESGGRIFVEEPEMEGGMAEIGDAESIFEETSFSGNF